MLWDRPIVTADVHAAAAATADENIGRVANPPYKRIFRAVFHAAGGATADEKRVVYWR
jgi:hypothetical protein